MIATGGLLRINARRQDSLRSKPHKPHPPKKKNKNKRRSEVVVVKGKLKLCSVSGLVAVLGVLVLMVGGVMAALGYWPRDGLYFSTLPNVSTAMASSSSTPAPPDVQPGAKVEQPKGNGGEEVVKDFNYTETINGTTQQSPQTFLEDFLDRYLYSDRLKVFGPLIMGIGIFLFICANAVLHENRDKKTKVINLRDIYSTVIDVHSNRKPTSSGSARSSSTNPLNGLVNYVQSKSLETKSRTYPPSLLTRRDVGGAAGSGDGGGIFSIYQDQPETPPPPSSSYSPPSIPACWYPRQKEVFSSTLPLRRPRPLTPRRRHSIWGGSRQGWGGADRGKEEPRRVGEGQEEEVCAHPPSPLCTSTPPPQGPLQELSSGGSQALLHLSHSHLSLSSLSHLLSSPSSPLAPPHRRQSLPTGSINAGYNPLSPGEEESCDWASTAGGARRLQEVTSRRRFSDREELKMMSQVRGEEEEEG